MAKMIKRKHKYDRRRAIDCKLERRSGSNPEYCKYIITIAEKDGTVHKEPAYGKDMQDALSRLMNIERTVRIERKMEKNPLIFFLVWMGVMLIPTIWHKDITYSPWFIVYMFVSFILLFGGLGVWQNYIDKGKERR